MFVLKILALCLLCVFCTVFCDDPESFLTSRYKFNHPPQLESYQSIPVAIIYDEPGSTSLKFAAKEATTYHPKLSSTTEQKRYEESSSLIPTDDFPEEEEKRVESLRKKLRKARLQLRTHISSNDATTSTDSTFQSLEDASITTIAYKNNETPKAVYKEINRNKQTTPKVKPEDLVTIGDIKIERTNPSTIQNETTIHITTIPEKTSVRVNDVKTTEYLQPPNRGGKRGQRVKPMAQADPTGASVGVIYEATSKSPKFQQPKKIEMRGRGSVRYRNSEQLSTVSSVVTNVSTTFEKLKKADLMNSRGNIHTTTEQYINPTRQKSYIKSEKPKFTNNNSGNNPISEKTQVENTVLPIINSGQGITDRSYQINAINRAPQDGQQMQYLSESPINSLEIKSRVGDITAIEKPTSTTTGEDKIAQFTAGTQNEIYPKVPISIIQLQMEDHRNATTLLPFTTVNEENKSKSPLALQSENSTSLPSFETENIKPSVIPEVIESVTSVPKIATKEENYLKANKPWRQFKDEVTDSKSSTNILLDSSTFRPETYQDLKMGSDNHGKAIAINPSFKVAVPSPLPKSELAYNDPATIVYSVQPQDFALETATEKILNENQRKPLEQKHINSLHGQIEEQIPVVIIYDNSASPSYTNKRTKGDKSISSQIVQSKSAKLNDGTQVKNAPKSGKVTENVNAERRTRGREPVVPILESENHVYAQSGNFNYRYESGDGTNAFQEGVLKPFDDDVTGEAVKGGFSYTDKDGNDFSLSYTADENGYRPVGAHLPTPPPIPPAIARALAYLATKSTPNPDEVTESALADIY